MGSVMHPKQSFGRISEADGDLIFLVIVDTTAAPALYIVGQ